MVRNWHITTLTFIWKQPKRVFYLNSFDWLNRTSTFTYHLFFFLIIEVQQYSLAIL
jgi:hypothetical protein